MSAPEFKDMCRQLKVFPVVVSEETADKITVFCAKKSQAGDTEGQTCFEFMDFIRAFKVSDFAFV